MRAAHAAKAVQTIPEAQPVVTGPVGEMSGFLWQGCVMSSRVARFLLEKTQYWIQLLPVRAASIMMKMQSQSLQALLNSIGLPKGHLQLILIAECRMYDETPGHTRIHDLGAAGQK